MVQELHNICLFGPRGAPLGEQAPRHLRTNVLSYQPPPELMLCFGYTVAAVMKYLGYHECTDEIRKRCFIWRHLPQLQQIRNLEDIMAITLPIYVSLHLTDGGKDAGI